MVVPAYVHSGPWLNPAERDRFFVRLGRALTISLTLHVALLLAVAGLRLAPRGDRPLTSVEVSLVSLPTPPKPKEVPTPAPPPAPPVKSVAPAVTPAVVPAPPVKSVTPAVVPARTSVAKDILKDLELPPDAPKFGELTPVKAVAQLRPEVRAKVKVPELPRIPDVVPDQAVRTAQPPSISEEVDRELEEELKKVSQFKPAPKLEIPKAVPVKPAPQKEASIPQIKAPQAQLKTSGSSGTNPYWARIEAIIKSQWEPPPINVTGQTYSAVVKFRFYRNGTVKDVEIQQTSGNSYFDLAGQRAVRKQPKYPEFPTEMTESYQDVEMVFRVGETAG